jgi:starvation-inducible outer membrane lipoprotein
MRKAIAALILGGALLAGCSTPPTTLSNPRDSIMLQWEPGKTSESAVKTTAERHCRSWGKEAVPGDAQEKDGARIQTFRCD